MKLLERLLGHRKKKEQLNKLVAIAENANLLSSTDIELLKAEMTCNISDHHERLFDVEKYQKSLPVTSKEKFQLVYFIVQSMMINGGLSDKKESVINKLIQTLNVSKDKATELTSFLKLNILNGLSIKDSFQRLGYLLEQSKYS